MHAPLGVSGEPRIVRDHADRRAFAMEVAQQVHHRLALFGIEVAGRPKSQIPNTKLQRNPKLQIPKPAAGSPPWSLGVGASLGFGAWFLEFSFASQRLHRIYLCRPSRGQPAGKQGYCPKQQRDSNECHGIGQTDAEAVDAQVWLAVMYKQIRE